MKTELEHLVGLAGSPRTDDLGEPWRLESLRGRLAELSACGANATLTAAFGVVLEAQQAGEPAAWVTASAASFYPPDVAAAGVDLAALVVVRVKEIRGMGIAIVAARAAEQLLRSGAFGLVVVDIGGRERDRTAQLPAAAQGRLVSLAQTHAAAIVCVTTKRDEAASLGALVSLRAAALRTRDGLDHFVTIRALKDKRRGPSWVRTGKVRGPAGY